MTVTAARGAFSVRELACVLRENQKNANVFRTSGELWFKGLPSKKILQLRLDWPAGRFPFVAGMGGMPCFHFGEGEEIVP